MRTFFGALVQISTVIGALALILIRGHPETEFGHDMLVVSGCACILLIISAIAYFALVIRDWIRG